MTSSIFLSFAAGCCLIVPAFAVEPAPRVVKLEVKKQLVESDRDKGASFGGQASKAYTLRVEVTNTGKEAVAGAAISGTALIQRARAMNERLTSEPLAAVEVPELKPNGKVTLDLGRIDLHKLVMRQRKMEETLEEWQVVCTKDGSELARAESSSRFETLSRTASAPTRRGKGKRK